MWIKKTFFIFLMKSHKIGIHAEVIEVPQDKIEIMIVKYIFKQSDYFESLKIPANWEKAIDHGVNINN